MKVTVTDREVKEVKREYPYFGENPNTHSIILFTHSGSGIKIYDTEGKDVGTFLDGWGEKDFTPLVNKTITIEV